MKRGGSLSFLVGTISNVLVMEIGWTDVGGAGYILVSCAHSNTSYYVSLCYKTIFFYLDRPIYFLFHCTTVLICDVNYCMAMLLTINVCGPTSSLLLIMHIAVGIGI